MTLSVREIRQAAGLTQTELARRSGVAQSNIAAYESGQRTASTQMIARLVAASRPRPSEALRRDREQVIAVLRRHGLEHPRVFGSAARGDDAPGSDLDLVVDVGPEADVLDLIDAADELAELLGCPVDLVTSRALRAGHEIERTAVAV